MFKLTISFLLIMVLMLTPLLSTTISAVEVVSAEENFPEEIYSEETNSTGEISDNGYSYGNYMEPDAVIPNPDYIPLEENMQTQEIPTNSSASTISTSTGRLEDGVYWINNAANGKYLDTLNGGVTSGTPVVQWTYSPYINGDENVYNRNQLFKVTYIGTNNGEDYYTIRPMTNNGLGLSTPTSSSSNLVDVRTMSTLETFANVSWYQKWVIKMYSDSDGDLLDYYTIESRFVDENTYLSVDTDDSNGSQVIMKDNLETLRQTWFFHPYTGPDIDGVGMTRFTTGVAKGSSFRYDAFSYSTTIGRNGPVTFSVTDRNGNTTDKAEFSSRILRGLEMGEVQIRTTYSGAPWLWLWNVDIQFEDGIVFLQNKYNSNFLQTDIGSITNMGNYNGSEVQQWELSYYRTEGYYKIKNVNSELYLTAPDTSSTYEDIIQQSFSTSTADRQIWEFTKKDDGSYRIRAKSHFNTSLSLYRDAEQYTYLNNNSSHWRVFTNNKLLDTPLITQQTSMWCWVTCAQMLVRTFYPTAANNGDIPTILDEQRKAVYHIFGDNTATAETYDWVNDPQELNTQGGVYWDVTNAARYLTELSNGDMTYTDYGLFSETEILSLLYDGSPVVRVCGYNKDDILVENEISTGSSDLFKGHVTIIVGYEWDETLDSYIYDVYDPNYGGATQYKLTYENLKTQDTDYGTYNWHFWVYANV